MLAVAATLVIITGGIDLSVGTLMTFCAVIAGVVLTYLGLPLLLGVVRRAPVGEKARAEFGRGGRDPHRHLLTVGVVGVGHRASRGARRAAATTLECRRGRLTDAPHAL